MPLQATSGAASYDGFGGGVAAVPKYIEDYFSTFLYSGTGAAQTITNGIDLSTKGGLTWIKDRGAASTPHMWFDTNRGVGKYIQSNSTGSQGNIADTLTSFNSNGFTLGADSFGVVNASGHTYTSWSWAKAPKFFDVVTWTGDASGNRTLSHSLSSTPGCIIVKATNAVDDWYVYHTSLGTGSYLYLDTTSATQTGSVVTAVSSTTFTVSQSNGFNTNGRTYVAYLFAHNAGGFGLTGTDNVISCGSFTYSGATTVTLGYEPQWILYKDSTNADNWNMFDTMRGWSMTNDKALRANTSGSEIDFDYIDPTSTGFTLKDGTNGATYIYIAIRRGPMKVPTDATKVFAPVAYTGDGSSTRDLTFGFPVDMFINNYRGVSAQRYTRDRLRGGTVYLSTPATDAEATSSSYNVRFDSNTGIDDIPPAWDNASGFTFVDYGFRRAPSFFDEVCYTGNSTSGRQLTHNLTVEPELMINKCRSNTTDWYVYSKALGISLQVRLNSTAAQTSAINGLWNSTAPTSSVFTVGNNAGTNFSGYTYVAYLFATAAGVSKCTAFTGNGSTQTINCGFTSGARFVMIKATSTTGNWLIFDTARGMTTSTDPWLALNSTAAESATTGACTTTSVGFTVDESKLTGVNTNGVSYIVLAVA